MLLSKRFKHFKFKGLVSILISFSSIVNVNAMFRDYSVPIESSYDDWDVDKSLKAVSCYEGFCNIPDSKKQDKTPEDIAVNEDDLYDKSSREDDKNESDDIKETNADTYFQKELIEKLFSKIGCCKDDALVDKQTLKIKPINESPKDKKAKCEIKTESPKFYNRYRENLKELEYKKYEDYYKSECKHSRVIKSKSSDTLVTVALTNGKIIIGYNPVRSFKKFHDSLFYSFYKGFSSLGDAVPLNMKVFMKLLKK